MRRTDRDDASNGPEDSPYESFKLLNESAREIFKMELIAAASVWADEYGGNGPELSKAEEALHDAVSRLETTDRLVELVDQMHKEAIGRTR